MKKAEGKENRATVDASKVKEENLEVAGGKCWRGFWLSALNVTGEIVNQFPMNIIFVTAKVKLRISCNKKYFSETWILPSAVLLAMVAYTVLAIAFYNKDG